MLLIPQRSRKMRVRDGKVLGHKVSEYGLKHGYLDYGTLADMLGIMILDNDIMDDTDPNDWELVAGVDCVYDDEDGGEPEYYHEFCQYYIISYPAYYFLKHNTDEVVYYNDLIDLYVWGVQHCGTSWDYVLTDIELVK